jgi:hypothetical protein
MPEIIFRSERSAVELGTSSASPLLRFGGEEKYKLPFVEIVTVL